ncbi:MULTISPECIES: Mu transposase C-terminal domain-containing protein [unclassified Serratia (in: enterobacteria)]|uniref:Mu transposase C-terminal domain-containing protein n=1 Tax=unclassified Serratia (in: enterobacteria) TaxID=2647522 RepID=UPI0027F00F82|nr:MULTISPECIES: Mu transposase C-terminal domain-containing protein [unclassified Serratia (in: enterobacteria)]ELH4246188.1 transposase [Serratia marcescens]MDQ7097392.1 Mu transposase C-terminal domain-containing protein [Serratia sp. MF2]MDQ7104905.1 Mu transposase C-terminal domain-containing protein [Serratia sp. MF1(2023)]
MFFVAKELVGIPGLPKTAKGIREALCRFSAGSESLVRKRTGSKAFEYHIDCLPDVAQQSLRARQIKELMNDSAKELPAAKPQSPAAPRAKGADESKIAVYRKCPALLEQKLNTLTAAQRQTADARMALVVEVMRLGDLPGFSRAKAIREIVRQAQASELPERLANAAAAANAKKGTSRSLSEISLKRWVADFNKTSSAAERLLLLAPGKRQVVKPEEIKWLPEFLSFYRRPDGRGIQEAYDDFAKEWVERYQDDLLMRAAIPSYDQVCYAMNKLPVVVKQKGRITGSEFRQYEGFIRRDWESLPVNYVWIGDGHGMKMKVAHPDHGNPFSPEVTFILDGSCRFIVGWSLALSESVIAVADALRHGIKNHGKPFLYYSDNGGGETNNTFDAELTGILPRLGIDHRLGIPENPQGRGIIERLNRSLAMRISRQFATYYGTGADRSTVRRMTKALQSATNAANKGKELSAKQEKTLRDLPSWEALIDAIEAGVEWYNNRPHDSLPLRGDGEHFTPAQFRRYKLEKEATAIEWLSDLELREMFMPQIERHVSRCEVRLFNNFYYSPELNNEHGNQVLVNYDLHDASKVIVRRLDGSFICEAIWDGNKQQAFPVTAEYHQRQQRIKGMRQRGEEKVRLAEAENVHTLAAPAEQDWLPGNVYKPVRRTTPVMLADVEDAEYSEDEYLNNSLDILESNKRKNAI